MRQIFVAAALSLTAATALAQPETLEISFDLQQYTQDGDFCFAAGGNHPDRQNNNLNNLVAAGRRNWVHATVVWLEDDSGNYMTTLYRWGRTYTYNLEQWAIASNMVLDSQTESTPTTPPPSGSGTTCNDGAQGGPGCPDQVFRIFSTGAIDVSALPDGNYFVRLESTFCEVPDEYIGNYGPWSTHFSPATQYMFTKGRSSQSGVSLGGDSLPFNSVTADYVVPGGNNPPQAWAGPDDAIMPSVTPFPDTVTLNGVVGDDSGATPTVLWTQVGYEPAALAGVAQIVTDDAATTDVVFDLSGIYTFRLTATDGGGLSTSDEVTVSVNTHIFDSIADSHLTRGPSNAWQDSPRGTLDASDPWILAGGCTGSTNIQKFDIGAVTASIDMARLRLPFGEGTWTGGAATHFFMLDDSEDAAWDEATVTYANAPVPGVPAAPPYPRQLDDIDTSRLVGTHQHLDCRYRHSYDDPAWLPNQAGNDCPGWRDTDLDTTLMASLDGDGIISLVQKNSDCTPGVTNTNTFLQLGNRENLTNPHLVVVEHWQAGPNAPPTADASNTSLNWVDTDGTGDELVDFDGGASTDTVGISTYEWRDGSGTLLGADGSPTGVSTVLPLGVHDIELTVIDGGALSDTDTVQLVVDDRFGQNRDTSSAGSLSGAAAPGADYANLFAYTTSPGGDWYELNLAGGGDLTVDVSVDGGDLDVRLMDSSQTELDTSAQAGSADEQVGATGLAPGTYYIEVAAATGVGDASTYAMNITVAGATLSVNLTQSSGLESAGTIDPVGTVSANAAVGADLTVDLVSSSPGDLGFVTTPVTISAGTTSADFGIVLTDNGAVDGNRLVSITASASNYNQGAADFQVQDDDGAGPIVSWDRASDSSAETGSPLVSVRIVSSEQTTVTVPISVSGTATAGADFVALPSDVTISNDTEVSLLISVLDDSDAEVDETLIITIGSPSGALVGVVDTFTLTITDDDGGAGGTGGGNTGGTGGAGGTDGGNAQVSGCAAAAPQSQAVGMLLLVLGLSALRRRRRGT